MPYETYFKSLHETEHLGRSFRLRFGADFGLLITGLLTGSSLISNRMDDGGECVHEGSKYSDIIPQTHLRPEWDI